LVEVPAKRANETVVPILAIPYGDAVPSLIDLIAIGTAVVIERTAEPQVLVEVLVLVALRFAVIRLITGVRLPVVFGAIGAFTGFVRGAAAVIVGGRPGRAVVLAIRTPANLILLIPLTSSRAGTIVRLAIVIP
jgi:hypothetical protein